MGIFYEKDDLESLRDSWTSKSPLGVGLIFGFTTILGKCQNLALRQLRTYSNLSAVDHEWFMKADWRTSRNTIDLIYEFAVHSVQNQLIKRVLRFRSPFHVTLNSKVGPVVYLARKFNYDGHNMTSTRNSRVWLWPSSFDIEKVQHAVWLWKEVIYQKIFDFTFGIVLGYSFLAFYL